MEQNDNIIIEDNITEDTVIEDDSQDETIPFKYSISYYGADFDVHGLVRRINSGDIHIPSFQRDFVWTFKQASRFVESLLVGLPVPGIFLSEEEETRKLLVIDGQQRLRTLQYFYKGEFTNKKPFALEGVTPEFEGATYNSLRASDRRRLDNSLLHAIIVKQDEPSDDNSSIYHIFERLNTGGTQLQAQEIRAAIYHGEFNDLLAELNNNKHWRLLYNNGEADLRMRDQEFILRFLALYLNDETYRYPMREFLNTYMGNNRHLTRKKAWQLERLFTKTIKVANHFGPKAFKPKRAINAAFFDAVMVGLARRLERGKIQDYEALKQQYQALLNDNEFISATYAGTSQVENVKSRLEKATAAFANVG
jgi:hypothetical protein